MKYLSVCMNFKDEAPYLKEWLDYHLVAGVEHFFLFDNNSTDNYLDILKPYREKKLVTLHSSNKNPVKPVVYQHVLNNYSDLSRWIGFIDCDEYVCPIEKNDLKDSLRDYEKYPAVGINWKMFGSSGHDKKPDGLVIENYTIREDETKIVGGGANHHIKSFINPKKVIKAWVNPHYFLYDPGACFPYIPAAVNENYKVIDGLGHEDKMPNLMAFSSEVSHKKFAVNHYWCKSKEEFINRKLSKPRDDNGQTREMDFTEFDKNNDPKRTVEDREIFKFVEKVKNFSL